MSTPAEENYDNKVDLRHWRKLLAYAMVYRSEVTWLGVCAVGTALSEVLFPLVTRALIDDVDTSPDSIRLWPYVGAYAALVATLAGCVVGFIWQGGKIRTHVGHDIRRDGFENLQRLSFSFYDQRNVGWLMARMTSDCDRLANILAWGVLDLIWGVTFMIGIVVALFVLDAGLAALVLCVVPMLVWISAVFQKRILRSARVIRKTNSRITGAFNEGIMGVRTSKVFVRERSNLGDFRGLTDEMLGATVRNAMQSALYPPLLLTMGSLATGLALAAGGFEVLGSAMSLGTLVSFMTYIGHFFDPIHELAARFAELQMAQASAERILSLVEAVPEIQDAPEVSASIEANAGAVPVPGRAEDGLPERIGEIAFRGVSFAYRDGPTVLENFELVAREGETIALVGPTGGGKSTIVSLLCRFYEPTSGTIEIDGVDYRARSLRWLQSKLGIVLQAPHLFSGSVAENIRYGRLDASDEEIAAAARLAGADSFIREFEHGYSTEVGEGGGRLSTGQKQLVSFARAVLADPQILVMDEATSSVDTETERHIQRGLANVLSGRTAFVIAHRLSTIRAADRILVIEAGRIAEQGNHAELMRARGAYHELYTEQSLRDRSRDGSAWSAGEARGEGAPVTGT